MCTPFNYVNVHILSCQKDIYVKLTWIIYRLIQYVIVYPSPTYMFRSFVRLRRFKHIHAQSVFSVGSVTAWLLLKIYINYQNSLEKLHFYIPFRIYFTILKCNLPPLFGPLIQCSTPALA